VEKSIAFVQMLDWRALSSGEARASGISYRLANRKEGTITDPAALRTFYYRIFYGQKINQETEKRERRLTPGGRQEGQTG
jgi:hypothetical protein